MRSSIPDLYSHQNEFTIEHCSVLLERLGKTLDEMYVGGDFTEIAAQADAQQMRSDLLEVLTANQLSKLFDTELGKGLIIGMFYSMFVLPQRTTED